MRNPETIFEVLSDSTESYDRGKKFAQYRRLESLREYVIIAQDQVYVERYTRHGDEWLLTELSRLEDTLRRYGSSTFADDARWYLGFARWRLGDAAGALADFTELAHFTGALSGGKGLYWAGRALDRLGRLADDQRRFGDAVRSPGFAGDGRGAQPGRRGRR